MAAQTVDTRAVSGKPCQSKVYYRCCITANVFIVAVF